MFSLDGQDFDVENNVWLVGDDREVLVIDAAHDAQAILDAVGDRDVVGVVCTHGHNDHINAALAVRNASHTRVVLHRGDRMLWSTVYGDLAPDAEVGDGQVLSVAGTDLHVLHTPGHSPGGVCLYAPTLSTLFSGDTLFAGGPGATGRSYSDFPTIIESIRTKLLSLPSDTTVHPGHGDSTEISAEAPHLEEWITRGH